jgi:hypothetical protein
MLTQKRKKELANKWGHTESELIDLLNDPDLEEDDEDGGDDISELATNMGYVWSFRLNKWFDKNQGQLDEDADDFEVLLAEIKKETERS